MTLSDKSLCIHWVYNMDKKNSRYCKQIPPRSLVFVLKRFGCSVCDYLLVMCYGHACTLCMYVCVCVCMCVCACACVYTCVFSVQAGTVWTNCWMVRDLNMPFGGMKASGTGREGFKDSMEFFTESKTICIKM